jgi:ribose 5-phosphate isomerase B
VPVQFCALARLALPPSVPAGFAHRHNELMRIAVAADHAGFDLKQFLAEHIRKSGHQVADLGTHEPNQPDDYPDFAAALGRSLQRGEAERGLLICGSGVGASIAVNKLRGIRAGLCHDSYSARQGVEHDDMNVLVLGSRIIGTELARDLVDNFLRARFSGDPRHARRLDKVRALDQTRD